MDPSHWIDSFFGFEKDKSKKKKTIHLVGENCPAKLPFITSVINYVFNVKFGDTFRFQLDIQRADSTYRYFSDFSGPFVFLVGSLCQLQTACLDLMIQMEAAAQISNYSRHHLNC